MTPPTYNGPEVAILVGLAADIPIKTIAEDMNEDELRAAQLALKTLGLINAQYTLTPRGWRLVHRGVYDASQEGI